MFKSLEIKKNALLKIPGDKGELLKADVEGQLKSLPPGEWILLRDPHRKRIFLGYANPLVEDKMPAVQVLQRLVAPPRPNEAEIFLQEKLTKAFARRACFAGYESGSRLVFGESDDLPGLIVDSYANAVLVQINTAGMDRHRAFIRDCVSAHTSKEVFFLDNPAQRSKEMLPHYRSEKEIPPLEVVEDNFRYEIPRKNLQKIGWYYDHRENRTKLESVLGRWRGSKDSAVDLFCYGGAWGLHALRAGFKHVDFVDQASLKDMVERHLELNHFSGRGKFHHKDVFDWLDQALSKEQRYNLVISDPPAFAKSPREKKGALDGYRKLHRKVLRLAGESSLVVAASCTHYVTMEEFLDSVTHAAHQEGRVVRLLDLGLQGWDHPIKGPEDRSNYIKYALLAVE